ncbi:hypothetical protein [Novosphingobium soli]|uniref:Uncharacterized protein n=1 Tax=Novosphingobium soli TaxID=574956 RepID=A0ABV6CTW7_9SPHN
MTIRFAAAWKGAPPALAPSLCTGAPLDSVNDNPPLPVPPRAARRAPRDDAEHEASPAGALTPFQAPVRAVTAAAGGEPPDPSCCAHAEPVEAQRCPAPDLPAFDKLRLSGVVRPGLGELL